MNEKYLINDICDVCSSKRIYLSEYQARGIPFYRGKEIIEKDSNRDISNELFISHERYNEIKEKFGVPVEGDILMTAVGTIGVSWYVNESNFYFKDGNLIWLKNFKKDNVNSKYLYYIFKSKMFSEIIRNISIGSTQKAITIEQVKKIQLNFPKIDIQNRIVNILDGINDKIRINNEINNNLHELMKIKFNNCIDNLEEYEESVLSKIANYKNGLAMQKFRPIDESGLPVIKIKEMNSGITSETERCRSDIDSDVIIDNGDILFAWSGTLCMNIWCGGRAGLNQHIFKVTSDKYPKWFYYFWTLKHLDNFIEIAAGKATTMGHIKRTELDKAIVKIPNEKIMEKMDKIFTPMLNKYVNNSIESKSLSELRDTLLPKLMNGEIDLDNIEI